MILTEVYPDNQLIWADAVPCGTTGSTFVPKAELQAPFNSQDALCICFLNEANMRCSRYEILHYTVTDYHDDGPPALDQIVEACRLIEEGLKANKQVVVYVPEGAKQDSHRRFSALCVAAHRVLVRGETAAQAAAPWQTGSPAEGNGLSFYINSWAHKRMPAPPRALPMLLFLQTLETMRTRGWLDMSFDTKEYLSLWRQYDLSWMVPGEIQVLGDPVSTVMDPDPATISSIEPKEAKEGEKPSPSFVSYFQEHSVKLLVRLNLMSEPGLRKSYDAEVFTKHSIDCLDASYDDINGGVPSKQVLRNILTKCTEVKADNEKAVTAFHCKAGFGRSVVCALTWLIYRYDLPGDVAFAWSRMCRPGSITTPQQARFLMGLKGKAPLEDMVKTSEEPSCCAVL
mmetsp:Transcript_12146/g.27556  ORF Transcript_12146/g.27556 Transcript_12146/m.27556 type:complete len:399 (-) Transcript_12146:131-1327(-)